MYLSNNQKSNKNLSPNHNLFFSIWSVLEPAPVPHLRCKAYDVRIYVASLQYICEYPAGSKQLQAFYLYSYLYVYIVALFVCVDVLYIDSIINRMIKTNENKQKTIDREEMKKIKLKNRQVSVVKEWIFTDAHNTRNCSPVGHSREPGSIFAEITDMYYNTLCLTFFSIWVFLKFLCKFWSSLFPSKH